MQGILDRNYRKNVEIRYNKTSASGFVQFLSDLFQDNILVPTFINVPQLEGLSNDEIEIVMAQYRWDLESFKASEEYDRLEQTRKQEMDAFIHIIEDALEIYCNFNVENPEYDEPRSENDDDEEDWEL